MNARPVKLRVIFGGPWHYQNLPCDTGLL